MTTKQTFAITFIARENQKEREFYNIYARITIGGKRSEFVVVKSIIKESWNSLKERLNSKHKDFRKANLYIDQVRSKLTNIHRELTLKEELISPLVVKNHFLGNAEEDKTLMGLFEYHNNSQKNILKGSTLLKYDTTKKYVSGFLINSKKLDDIFLSKVDYQFITEFDSYLRSYQPKDHHKPLGNNGVMKHLERLKKVTSMAYRLEWMEKRPFEKFKFTFIKSEREFLTEQELEILKEKEFNTERLQLVNDLFVFSCYTGLAYIDVYNLSPDNLVLGIDGECWIQTVRQKTEMVVNIPILPVALGIVNKYKDHPRGIHNGTVFPKLSNQKLNSYLKEVADICGIKKLLTFHMARHTFATTVTLSNGVPIETVSKVLGHSNLSATMIYARVLKNKISEDMNTLKATLQEKESKPIKRKKYNT